MSSVFGSPARATGIRVYWTLLQSLAISIVLIGVVIGIASSKFHRHSSGSETLLAAVVVAFVGMVLQLVADRVERPLNGSSAAALLLSYRARFFLRVGFGEAPTMISIVAVVLTGRWEIFIVGALFALVTFARLAPTSAHLDRDQQAIAEAGSTLSLRDTLNGTASGPTA